MQLYGYSIIQRPSQISVKLLPNRASGIFKNRMPERINNPRKQTRKTFKLLFSTESEGGKPYFEEQQRTQGGTVLEPGRQMQTRKTSKNLAVLTGVGRGVDLKDFEHH